MNQTPSIVKTKILIERIGLSDIIPIEFVQEIILYTNDITRTAPLGIEGKICKTIKDMYYIGTTDLSVSEGVIQLLKDIESSMTPTFLVDNDQEKGNVLKVPIIDIKQYLTVLNTVTRVLNPYKSKKYARVKTITDVSNIQFAHPLFSKKFSEKSFKRKLNSRSSINQIVILEDGSKTMMKSKSLNKLAGLLMGIAKSFKGKNIIKYNCLDFTMQEAPLHIVPDIGIRGNFKLHHYLQRIKDADLIIVCTDANINEFTVKSIAVPTILFNLTDYTFNIPSNLIQISI